MKPVFRNHTIICGWNERGKSVVDTLQLISKRPIIIVNSDVARVISEVGQRTNLFVICGDCANRNTLLAADVPTAWSVVVLVDDSLGASADARSVKIAIAVEKIQVTVHTVAELRAIESKAHFRWTKVDELVADEDISAKMMAQAIRHVLTTQHAKSAVKSAAPTLLGLYHQLLSPYQERSQLFRANIEFEKIKNLTFTDILTTGTKCGVLPVALCGYRRHEIAARPGQEAWISWKTDVRPNPPYTLTLSSLWPSWPDSEHPLGVLCFSKTLKDTEQFGELF